MTSPVRHQWLSGDINSAFCGGKVIRSLQCVLQIQQATNIFHWCIYNSQCFQPILCKNLSSCLYKSWFDWKETLRLQIKNLSRYHTQRFSKQISHLSSFNFKKLLFKFGCVGLLYCSWQPVVFWCEADEAPGWGWKPVPDSEVSMYGAEGGRWLGPNLCPPVLTPPSASVSRKLTLRWLEL